MLRAMFGEVVEGEEMVEEVTGDVVMEEVGKPIDHLKSFLLNHMKNPRKEPIGQGRMGNLLHAIIVVLSTTIKTGAQIAVKMLM